MDVSELTRDADVTPAGTTVVVATGGVGLGQSARRPRRRVDTVYHGSSLVVSLSLLVIMVGILYILVTTAWPAITRLGPGFLVGTVWDNLSTFGALPFIVGTLLTTAVALLLAIPASLAIGILLTEYAPTPFAVALGIVVDVAAGVPTIVFGAWSYLALAPWMRDTFDPAVRAILGWLPFVGQAPRSEGGFNAGVNVLSACIVLAAMIFPTATAVIRSVLQVTPSDMREASLGIGATTWETATRVVLRQARAGILGAIVLACGRALGETIAVAYVIGGAPYVPRSFFDQGATLATELFGQVFQGGAAPGTLEFAALYELALILLLFAFLASLGGRALTKRLGGAALVVRSGR